MSLSFNQLQQLLQLHRPLGQEFVARHDPLVRLVEMATISNWFIKVRFQGARRHLQSAAD